MSEAGHTMSVELSYDTVTLKPVCHEPPGAICKVTCPQGCESYTYPEHEHGLTPTDTCNAVECLTSGDMVTEMCSDKRAVLLRDGMPIDMEWDGDCYYWSPAL